MSRAIKFRAWDKVSRAMKYWEDYSPPTLLLEEYLYDEEDELGFKNDGCVMQYIGIKDHTGQEVYEGDIIALKEESFDEGAEDRVLSLHEVVWGGDQYPAWTLKPSIETECNVFSHLVCATEAPKFEVVGNIHEDLAKEKDDS